MNGEEEKFNIIFICHLSNVHLTDIRIRFSTGILKYWNRNITKNWVEVNGKSWHHEIQITKASKNKNPNKTGRKNLTNQIDNKTVLDMKIWTLNLIDYINYCYTVNMDNSQSVHGWNFLPITYIYLFIQEISKS